MTSKLMSGTLTANPCSNDPHVHGQRFDPPARQGCAPLAKPGPRVVFAIKHSIHHRMVSVSIKHKAHPTEWQQFYIGS